MTKWLVVMLSTNGNGNSQSLQIANFIHCIYNSEIMVNEEL